MNYQDIKNETTMEPLYILSGDAFVCNMAKEELLKKFEIDAMSISVYDDENFNVLDMVNSANQFSFFNTKRAVVINNLTNDLSKNEQVLFNNYLDNPNNNAVIIIINSISKTNFDFVKSKKLVECVPSDSFVQMFIKNEFDKNGKQVDSSSSKRLAEMCLNNILKIRSEIKKICDFLQDDVIVTQDVLDKLVTTDTELKVFDLTVALSNKDIKKAHKVLYDMLEAGDPPTKILGLVASHFRRVFFAKISTSKSNLELAKELGVKEYAIVKAKQDASKFTAKQLKKIVNLILEVDYAIKSGQMGQENAMYYLVFSIVNI